MVATDTIPDWVRLASVVPEEFRRRLQVDTGDGPELWDRCMDPWQREDFAALDPGWRRAIGLGQETGIQRAYLERPRGHSKTTDIAAMTVWALFAARKPIRGVVVAEDKDQAQLIVEATEMLQYYNPWLKAFIRVHNYEIKNPHTGSTCKILAADVAGNFGKTPDFTICDELTHWTKPGMWDVMFSAIAKKKDCMLVIISNAGSGEGTSWQWKAREMARTSPKWYFRRLDGPTASWITPDLLDEQRQGLPGEAFKRLWLNQWVRGVGDALEPADIEAAMTLAGPPPKYYEGWSHVMGLDLGVRRDHAALVVLAGLPGFGRVRLAHVQSWKPPEGGEISLPAVRQAVLDQAQRFTIGGQPPVLFYDPHQAVLMAQDLRRNGLVCEEMTFVGQNLNRMASAILQVFRSRKIDLYRDRDLEADLLRLMIVEKSYGYKLEACHDENGHADRATALAIALPTAAEISELPIYMPVDDGLGHNLALGVPG